MAAEILDACCGGRWWWWDRQHPLAVYMDERVVPAGTRPDRPNWSVEPDVVGDFRAMSFEDDSFQLVVFDPPHMIQSRISGNVTLQYGVLNPETAADDLRRGFSECWRVLAPGGTLVFKWAGPLDRVRPHFPATPIVGTKTARRNGAARGTRWIIFYKPLTEEAISVAA